MDIHKPKLSYTLQLCKAVLIHHVRQEIKSIYATDNLNGVHVSVEFRSAVKEHPLPEGTKRQGIKYGSLEQRIDCEIIVKINTKKFDVSHLEEIDHSIYMEELGLTKAGSDKESDIVFAATSTNIRKAAERLGTNSRELMAALEEVQHVNIKNYEGRVLNQRRR